MSSLFGLLSIPGQSMYNATKYAVRGFSESLREELLMAGHPVGVTVVHPGGMQDRDRAQRAGVVARGPRDASTRMFDDQLAQMSPERAAEIILRGVLRGKPRVLVGLDAHLLHQFARVTGARYQDVVARASGRLARTAAARDARSPGDPVEVRMTKWGDRPHWEFACLYLGDDEHGDWLGFPRGTQMTRPGRRVRLPDRPGRPGPPGVGGPPPSGAG